MLNSNGRNWGQLVNWDDLGKAYAAIAISWTVVLYTGITWLVIHRHLPHLKIRNIPLVITATSFLHVYLVKILLAYMTNGHFLCSAEFWIMSIYLPFGIALFQANMVQLLSISMQQRRLLDGEKPALWKKNHPRELRDIRSRWRSLNALQQAYVLIGIGMLLQVVITGAIYGTNRKLQGHWGDIPRTKGQALCRKGPEWIPSSFWQLFWSCIYGPYLLYRVRNINDTHYWRLQITLCVICGFPGTPLWLAAVFSPKFKPINKYWVPPMWLAPGIFVMQATTVFFPIYEYYTSNRLSKSTIAALKDWEDRENSAGTTLRSGPTTTSRGSLTSDNSCTEIAEYNNNKIYTMAALEKVLTVNPHSLLHFAATKDFTAENILFLMAVRDWRSAWPNQSRSFMFSRAVHIYVNQIHEGLAEFPINIEWRIKSRLDEIFGLSVSNRKDQHTQFNEAIPFANPKTSMSSMKCHTLSTEEELHDMDFKGFDETVFNAAEKSVKYLVLTNTWRKYINEIKETRK